MFNEQTKIIKKSIKILISALDKLIVLLNGIIFNESAHSQNQSDWVLNINSLIQRKKIFYDAFIVLFGA